MGSISGSLSLEYLDLNPVVLEVVGRVVTVVVVAVGAGVGAGGPLGAARAAWQARTRANSAAFLMLQAPGQMLYSLNCPRERPRETVTASR